MSFYFIQSQSQLETLACLKGAPFVAFDLETAGKNGLNPYQSRIRLVQLASVEDLFIIDLDKVDAKAAVSEILVHEGILKVAHNAKFDMSHIYHHWGVETKPVFCTFLAAKLLARGCPGKFGLAAVTRQYLNRELDKTFQQSDWSGTLTDEQIRYAANDVEVLVHLYPVMQAQLKANKLNRVSQLEFRTIMPVAAMELKGVYVDLEKWHVIERDYAARVTALDGEIQPELPAAGQLSLFEGENINLNSPDQVLKSLQLKGVPVKDTAESNLKPHIKDFPVIEKLLRYRHYHKILHTTFRHINEAVLPETGRIHPHYMQIASASGRFACSEPNIQQVPREKEVRACFVPATGYRYIIADYSQVELRVAAGMSGDAIMLQAYRKGEDLHRLTAALTMSKREDLVTNAERQAAKAINFGLIYAMGARGLQSSALSSYGVPLSLEQAETFRSRFFSIYRGIRHWQERLEAEVRKQGFVRTRSGRVRAYPRREDMRLTELLNIPVQGTAAEGLKSALCIFWDKAKAQGLDATIIAIIHDEIIVEAREDQAEQAKKVLEASMIQGISWLVPEVPFEAEAHIAASWAEK